MSDVYITGTGHTVFKKWQDTSLEYLIGEATAEAILDSGIDPSDIDEIFIGHFGEGFIEQGFISSLLLQRFPELRFKPITRVENACASGSAAVHNAARAVSTGNARHVLVIGAEHMTGSSNPGQCLARGSYQPEEKYPSFAHVFADMAQSYFNKYGDQNSALAKIAAKNYKHGFDNPLAHLRKSFSEDFCATTSDKNPMVAEPLKRSDCSPISDGAAALILSDQPLSNHNNVKLTYWAHVNDFLPMSSRKRHQLEGCEFVWKKGLSQCELALSDFQLVETHDCFTIAELMQYEAMGLTPFGEGHKAIEEGWVNFEGRLPVNLSGGLKSKGHPIGATGVSMHVVISRQLKGVASHLQLNKAQRGAVYNMGGTGVANYLSFLEVAN